ncbi:dedicator of cytokinesis protein 7 [Coccinella septempunctata]|uniref:dedicator of cytokinesis protein 7 n=1 Tax=Coccinella septempunctata TaxID=41139 RepID=UPI001D05DBC5|nr:dedicator of cytokinesis protein 7 [Coccinella septempunctata]
MSSGQRAFTQKLSKQHPAEVRRNVACHKSSFISPSSSTTWSNDLVEPFDFEEFVGQYQLLIDKDPLRNILEVPHGDVEVDVIERPIRTVQPVVPEEKIETLPPHVQSCIECYTSDWKVVRYNHRALSSSVASKNTSCKTVQPSPKQEFEVDFQVQSVDTHSEIDSNSISSSSRQSVISISSISSCGDTLTPRNSWASLDLRHSAGDPLIPEILGHASPETLDQINETRRQADRQDALFVLYSNSTDCEAYECVEKRLPAVPPAEPLSHRMLVKCQQLTLDIEMEPLFASMALYDAKEKRKVSETFHFDLNPEGLKRMLGGHIPYSDISTLARGCIFNISNPSPDLFLVIRLEKVLQGDLNECVEPYIKEDKNWDKLKANAVTVCERLGKYRQAFAWTAIYLMNVINGSNSLERESDRDSGSHSNTNSLERKSAGSSLEQLRRRATDMGTLTRRGSLERRDKRRSWSPDHLANSMDTFRPITLTVTSFFRQEGEKLKDDDLYKCLQELKRPQLILKKIKCIPATLKLEISPCTGEYKNCLTTELAKLLPYPDDKSRPIKELLEFPVKEILTPHYMYRNLLFVSPKELNFSNRAGSARNIAIKIQLMSGESEHHALYNIYGKSSCPEMTNEAYTAVTYHSKTPVFYDEIKIKLPATLADNHHLLFTFYHISCQRKAEQNTVDVPVGYSWLPLLRDGRLIKGEFCLPVMLEPPPRNYSYIPPDVCLPGTKWLDNHKGLFTVLLDTASSVHTHDPPVERFLSAYDYVHTGIIPARLGESGLENELSAAMLGLSGAKPETIIRHLPLIFDLVIQLLVQPPRLSNQTLNIGHTAFETLCLLLEVISNVPDLSVDQHSRNALLATYIQYQCNLPHPMGTSCQSSPEWEGRSNMARSNSNPDLEVAQLQQQYRGLDRAASMRVPSADLISPNSSTCQRIIHQELVLQWVVSSGRSKDLANQNAWFLFELTIKSMVEHLAHTRSLDAPRKLRFSEHFLGDISNLLQIITGEIIALSTGDIRRAHKLNSALAFFFFDLLSLSDRGNVFHMLRNYNKHLQTKIASIQDPSILIELKLEFMRIICSHEHYVALNLPFASPFMSSGAGVSPSPSVTSSTSQNSFLSGAPPSQDRSSAFAELSPEYRQHHYLSGLVLSDVATVLLEIQNQHLQGKAVDTIKSLLIWHDSDPRYSSPDAKRRVAALYLPILSIAMDGLPLLHHFKIDKLDRYVNDDSGPSNINQTVALAIAGKLTAGTCDTFSSARKSGLNAEVTRNLLTCVLWVLKNIEKDCLSTWLGELSSSRLTTLMQLLDACISCFEYKPRKMAPPPTGYAHAQGTQDMRSKLEGVILGQGSAREMMQRRKGNTPQAGTTEKLRWRKEQMAYRLTSENTDRPREELLNDVYLEGHFATEASFIILDTLERCVLVVAQWDSQQHLIGLALTVLLHALGKNQSTTVLPHMFASQRSLVYKFHGALFDEENSHCADLCLLLLKHCGSQIESVRSQAAASLYLLMRQTFQIGNNFARVKMQVTMSLSSLVGTSSSFSDDSLRRSLKTILEYAERDDELQETTFPEQVRDLIFNLHMILSDTVKMKEFQEDPEMLLDLMYRIAKGYQNSPDLRLTWLANMAQKHMERGNHTEAGMCLVHSAALVAEYLVMLESLPHLPSGAAALERVSPNVLEESAVSDDVLSPEREGGCLGSHFTEAGLLGLLEHAASSFHIAAMYEPMNDIYRVLIPIAENNRDFKKLANIHGKLHDAYTRIDQLQGKRMFGTYFRVGFYGSKFGDLDQEEFIYKEPTLTKLPEIFSRLENFYAERFGSDNVIIIKDSNIVDPTQLNTDKAYIQITYVEPYFEQYELRYRQTHFDRNFNIKRFVYATPFTMTGKPHGELKEQYKRKTILTTAVHFPYVKTRIQVVNRTQITLTPIEVAIEDIQKKTTELAASTVQEPPDPKILQMVLQGCIGTTVNQGPLEMALTFLPSDGKPLTKHQNKLRLCFKDFSKKCADALKKNKNLIGPDQRDYQRELDRNYKRFTEKLHPLVNPQNVVVTTSPHKYSGSETTSLRW